MQESINNFIVKSKMYNLTKVETPNIINIRPSSVVEIDPIVEDCDRCIGEDGGELVEMVLQVFPTPSGSNPNGT